MIVNEYLSPVFPGFIGRRYLDASQSTDQEVAVVLANAARMAAGLLEGYLNNSSIIKRFDGGGGAFFVVANHRGANLKFVYDEVIGQVEFTAILTCEEQNECWQVLCEGLDVVSPSVLIAAAATNGLHSHDLMDFHRLVIGCWEAGDTDVQILELIRKWMEVESPAVFCGVIADLQFALNYFAVLLPEIEERAQQKDIMESEYFHDIQILIESGKTELDEFNTYASEREVYLATYEPD